MFSKQHSLQLLLSQATLKFDFQKEILLSVPFDSGPRGGILLPHFCAIIVPNFVTDYEQARLSQALANLFRVDGLWKTPPLGKI